MPLSQDIEHRTCHELCEGFEPSYQSLKRSTSDLSFSSTSRSFKKPIAVRNTSLGDLQWHVLWWPTHISLHRFKRIHSCRVVNNKLASAPDKRRCRRPALMTPSAYPLPVLSLFSLLCPQLVLPSLSSACSSFHVLSLSSPLFQRYCSIELTLTAELSGAGSASLYCKPASDWVFRADEESHHAVIVSVKDMHGLANLGLHAVQLLFNALKNARHFVAQSLLSNDLLNLCRLLHLQPCIIRISMTAALWRLLHHAMLKFLLAHYFLHSRDAERTHQLCNLYLLKV